MANPTISADEGTAGAAAGPDPAKAKAVAALWRAMPPQRLLDGGMRYGDVLRLQEATDPNGAAVDWDAAAEALGDEHSAFAADRLAAGRTSSAAGALRAAAADYLFAQMPLADGDRKHLLYGKAVGALRALAGIPAARLSRVEVPFAGRKLVGWLVLPAGSPIGGVIAFGGQSGWGATYLHAADALAARGIATLLAEGPGQGESRLVQGIRLDVDVVAAFSAFADALVRAVPVDDGILPVGIWGNSMGGLYAALTAARDERIVACCVNGGIAAPRLMGMRTFDEQAAAMLGSDDPAAIQANFDRLRFDPSMRIAGDVLVVHGTADPLVSLADQQPFLDAADPARRTLEIWEGGDHTVYNRGDERNDVVADWFAERFSRSSRPAPATIPAPAQEE